MFYLCSIGSNLDPAQHVSQAVGQLLARFGRLRLSSVIQTKPVGMQSRHDFLNCLFVVQSELSATQLKAEFVTMELTHGRDRTSARVDAYLGDLLTEMYRGGHIDAGKVTLSLPGSKVFAKQVFGHAPVELSQPKTPPLPGNTQPELPARQTTIRHH